MMALNGCAGSCAAAFHHVGINGALYQKIYLAQFFRFFVKHVDKFRTDDFPFLFRIGHAFQLVQEAVRRIDPDEIHIEGVFENFFHLIPFVLAQKAVIHEDAGQLFANRFMYHHRRNGRIHTAAEGAQHFFVTHFCFNLRNFPFHKGLHGPVAF